MGSEAPEEESICTHTTDGVVQPKLTQQCKAVILQPKIFSSKIRKTHKKLTLKLIHKKGTFFSFIKIYFTYNILYR